jgi:hypothetical protein
VPTNVKEMEAGSSCCWPFLLRGEGALTLGNPIRRIWRTGSSRVTRLVRPAYGRLIHHEEAGRSHEGHEAGVAWAATGKPDEGTHRMAGDAHRREARIFILLRDLRVTFPPLRDKNRDRWSVSASCRVIAGRGWGSGEPRPLPSHLPRERGHPGFVPILVRDVKSKALIQMARGIDLHHSEHDPLFAPVKCCSDNSRTWRRRTPRPVGPAIQSRLCPRRAECQRQR